MPLISTPLCSLRSQDIGVSIGPIRRPSLLKEPSKSGNKGIGKMVDAKLKRKMLRAVSFKNELLDECIRNYNKLLWIKNDNVEPHRIWNMGKDIVVSYEAKESMVINRIKEIVMRGEMGKIEVGMSIKEGNSFGEL